MNDWERITLSDVVKLRRGHDLPTQSRHPGSVPIVGSFGITGWHDTAKAKGPGVTIGRSGASFGTAVYVAEDYWPLNTCLYVTDFCGNDPKWVYALLHGIDFSGYNSGSAQPSLNRNFLAAIPVRCPTPDEQRRIAAVLGALDDLIETSRGLVTGLENAARYLVAKAVSDVMLSSIAKVASARQAKPKGVVEHYSLPAFDNGAVPEVVDASTIKSNKLRLDGPTVLISRLNPQWERCWMAYPRSNAMSSTEFVALIGAQCAPEEIWAVTSGSDFWGQMRALVTGTTGSHQRVDKDAVLTLMVPDVRELRSVDRQHIVDFVHGAQKCRDEIAELTRARDELRPLLMSGRVRVREVA